MYFSILAPSRHVFRPFAHENKQQLAKWIDTESGWSKCLTQTSGQSTTETKSIHSRYFQILSSMIYNNNSVKSQAETRSEGLLSIYKKLLRSQSVCGSLSSQPPAQANLYLPSQKLNTGRIVFSGADRGRAQIFPERTTFPELIVNSVNFMWKRSPLCQLRQFC